MQSGYKNTKFLIVLVFSIFFLFSGCRSTQRVSKEVKQTEKAEAKLQKEADKEYQEAVKRHNKMQSKQSKQIMKDMKRAGKKENKGKKRSFWDRLFKSKDCPTYD